MAVFYSRKEGRLLPGLTLWVDDYIQALDAGYLRPEIARLGFKTFVSGDVEFPLFHYYTEEKYIDAFRASSSSIPKSLLPNAFPHNDLSNLASSPINMSIPTHLPTGDGAASARRPSLGMGFSRRPSTQAASLNIMKSMRPPSFQYAWTFYHDRHSEDGSWEGRLTVMLENIITLKAFWEAYNGFPLQALRLKDSVHFFKRGVKPVWEDPRNVKGGAWTFRISKDKSEQTWKEVLLLAVGEQFADVIQPSKQSPQHPRA